MKKNKESNRVVVTSKEQLKTAINQKKEHIEIQGDLARELKWIGKLSPGKIAALSAVLALAVGGATTIGAPVSVAALSVASVATVTGSEIAAIILASGMTVTLLLAILQGYEVEMQYNGVSMCLKRKE